MWGSTEIDGMVSRNATFAQGQQHVSAAMVQPQIINRLSIWNSHLPGAGEVPRA
jgi:hypothetical protein